MTKKSFWQIWETLTAMRETHENNQPVHPADRMRELLNQAGLPGAAIEAARHLDALKELGALGQVVIEHMGQPKSDTNSATGAVPDETPVSSEDGVIDITPDNQHLTDHE